LFVSVLAGSCTVNVTTQCWEESGGIFRIHPGSSAEVAGSASLALVCWSGRQASHTYCARLANCSASSIGQQAHLSIAVTPPSKNGFSRTREARPYCPPTREKRLRASEAFRVRDAEELADLRVQGPHLIVSYVARVESESHPATWDAISGYMTYLPGLCDAYPRNQRLEAGQYIAGEGFGLERGPLGDPVRLPAF
jgi:hypothetical protein